MPSPPGATDVAALLSERPPVEAKVEGMRLARPEDNAELLELMQVPMTGNLVLSTVRAPNFFKLYELQKAQCESWVCEVDSKLSLMSVAIVRDAWLDGKVQKVGYLGDLRTTEAGRKERQLTKIFTPLIENLRDRTGCEVFLTTVLASNEIALRALVQRQGKRVTQPYYHLLKKFSGMSIQFRGKRRPYTGALEVRTATPADLPAVTQLLADDHRQRIGGYRFDAGELEHRLAHWPGYTLDGLYLVHDRAGTLVGCGAAWDPTSVKQYKVLAYRGAMAWAKRAWNASALLSGWPKLPDAGGVFRYFYLSTVSIRDERPDVMEALLERVYADHLHRGYHFFSLYVDADDPLRPAMRRFKVQDLFFNLYAVTHANRPRTEFPPGRTGFEIALA